MSTQDLPVGRSNGMAIFALRIALFLVCQPSANAVLAEVYGVASLHDVVWFLAIPSYVILAAVWLYTRASPDPALRGISEALVIGAVGGFIGTVAYDVIRIPFVLGGLRVFVPNDTYGLWILNASASSRFSETVGWAYHFANGTTFGIMYALFMRGRHWAFGVAWAFLLETIALISPYGAIYHFAGDPWKIAIAYYGHVGYGVPLGLMVQRWDQSAALLGALPRVARLAIAGLFVAAIVGSLTSPAAREVDARTQPRTFLIDNGRLEPDWLRLPGPGKITVKNPCASPNALVVDNTPPIPLAPCEERAIDMAASGIHQIYVRTELPLSRSSFVLVEPVAAAVPAKQRSTMSDRAGVRTADRGLSR